MFIYSNFYDPNMDLSQLFEYAPSLKSYYYTDLSFSAILMVFSVSAGISLAAKKPGAVKKAKHYFLMIIGFAVFSLLLPTLADVSQEFRADITSELIKIALQKSVYVAIWYSYLSVSKRVKATYNEDISWGLGK